MEILPRDELLYIESLKSRCEKDSPVYQVLLSQPYSERYSFFITHNGINCTYAKIIDRHYRTLPMGNSSFNLSTEKDLTFRQYLGKILENENNELFLPLKKALCLPVQK